MIAERGPELDAGVAGVIVDPDEVLAKIAILEARDAPFRLTSPIESITKLDDGTLIVHTTVTTESPDNQRGVTRDGVRYDGEVIDYDAVKRAAPGLMEWASVKEMHDQDTASGTVLRLHFDDEARRVSGDLHVVDPVAVKKVLTKVYKAVSIGGYKRATRLMKMAGRTYRRVVELIWDEISLVDRPANKDAQFGAEFVLAKRDREEPDVTASDTRTIQQKAIDAAREDGRADAEDEPLAKVAGAAEADGGNVAVVDAEQTDETMAKAEAVTPAQGADATETAVAGDVGETVAEEPLAKAAVDPAIPAVAEPEAAAPATAAPAPLERLAKVLVNPVVDALQGALSSVTYALSLEAAEGDADDVAALQSISSAIQDVIVAEASEPPSPAEVLEAVVDEAVAEAVADVGETVVYVEPLAISYGRVRAQRALSQFEILAKAGGKSGVHQSEIDRMHDLTVALGASSHAAAAAAADAITETDEPLAKGAAADTGPTFAEQIRAVLVDVVPAGKLEAIERRLIAIDEQSIAQGQQLERIAKAEAGGGPANPYGRIYEAAARGAADPEQDPGAVLSAAAGLVDDPRLKSELGNQAALAQIKGARAGIG